MFILVLIPYFSYGSNRHSVIIGVAQKHSSTISICVLGLPLFTLLSIRSYISNSISYIYTYIYISYRWQQAQLFEFEFSGETLEQRVWLLFHLYDVSDLLSAWYKQQYDWCAQTRRNRNDPGGKNQSVFISRIECARSAPIFVKYQLNFLVIFRPKYEGSFILFYFIFLLILLIQYAKKCITGSTKRCENLWMSVIWHWF